MENLLCQLRRSSFSRWFLLTGTLVLLVWAVALSSSCVVGGIRCVGDVDCYLPGTRCIEGYCQPCTDNSRCSTLPEPCKGDACTSQEKPPVDQHSEPRPELTDASPETTPDTKEVIPEVPDVPEVPDNPDTGPCKSGERRKCYTGAASSRGKGVCRDGFELCGNDGKWGPCLGERLPGPEVCNGKDDDCDGQIDNEIKPKPCYTGPANTDGVGTCRQGEQSCKDGKFGPCEKQVLPRAEICGNQKDDDCDGAVDDECEWLSTGSSSSPVSGYDIIADSKNSSLYITGYFRDTAQFGQSIQKKTTASALFVGQMSSKGQWQWVLQSSGSGNASGQSLVLDGNGFLYVVGNFSGTLKLGTSSLTSKGRNDIFVAKIELSTQKIVWLRTAGGKGNDNVSGAVYFPTDKKLLLTGSASEEAAFGSAFKMKSNTSQMFVASITTAGNWTALFSISSSGTSEGEALALDNKGDIYIKGNYTGLVRFSNGSSMSSGSSNRSAGFLLKMDLRGKVLWNLNLPNTSMDVGRTLAIDPKGTLVLAGVFTNSIALGGKTLRPVGGSDIFVAGIQPATGKVSWTLTSNASGNERVYGLSIDSKGLMTLTGTFEGQTSLFGSSQSLQSSGLEDIFLLQLDTSRKPTLARRAGGRGNDAGFAVLTPGNGWFFLTGTFESKATFGKGSNAPSAQSSGSDDLFVWGFFPTP